MRPSLVKHLKIGGDHQTENSWMVGRTVCWRFPTHWQGINKAATQILKFYVSLCWKEGDYHWISL